MKDQNGQEYPKPDLTLYEQMAKAAREEGFDDIAEWFESLATQPPALRARGVK